MQNNASPGDDTADTRAGRATPRPLTQVAPNPSAPNTTSFSPGNRATPNTHRPSRSNPISVPNRGTPWTNGFVPSIGSRTQR